eukprot:Hpha_TRINITY_DN28047_c0_g1::TRINITY_DN28047_c0_g1_i1::g.42529::m.42529
MAHSVRRSRLASLNSGWSPSCNLSCAALCSSSDAAGGAALPPTAGVTRIFAPSIRTDTRVSPPAETLMGASRGCTACPQCVTAAPGVFASHTPSQSSASNHETMALASPSLSPRSTTLWVAPIALPSASGSSSIRSTKRDSVVRSSQSPPSPPCPSSIACPPSQNCSRAATRIPSTGGRAMRASPPRRRSLRGMTLACGLRRHLCAWRTILAMSSPTPEASMSSATQTSPLSSSPKHTSSTSSSAILSSAPGVGNCIWLSRRCAHMVASIARYGSRSTPTTTPAPARRANSESSPVPQPASTQRTLSLSSARGDTTLRTASSYFLFRRSSRSMSPNQPSCMPRP